VHFHDLDLIGHGFYFSIAAQVECYGKHESHAAVSEFLGTHPCGRRDGNAGAKAIVSRQGAGYEVSSETDAERSDAVSLQSRLVANPFSD
jgi:hypothetical protein